MQTNRIFNVALIDAESMGADITSESYDISEAIGYSVQAVWSAGSSPVGSFIIQGSNDGTNFTDIVASAVSGNSGSLMFNVEICRYAHACFERSS